MDITFTPKYEHPISPQELFGLSDEETRQLLNGDTVRLQETIKYNRDHPVLYFTGRIISDTSFIINAICGTSKIEYRWTTYSWRIVCIIADEHAWSTEMGIIGERIIDMYADDRLIPLRSTIASTVDRLWFAPIPAYKLSLWLKNRHRFAKRAGLGKAIIDNQGVGDLVKAVQLMDDYRLFSFNGLPENYTVPYVDHYGPYINIKGTITNRKIAEWCEGLTDAQLDNINHPHKSLKSYLVTISTIRYIQQIATSTEDQAVLASFMEAIFELSDMQRGIIATLFNEEPDNDWLDQTMAVVSDIYNEVTGEAS